MSIVHGAASGPAPSVVADMRPKNAAASDMALRDREEPQRPGMCRKAEPIEAARSVRLLQDASRSQRAA